MKRLYLITAPERIWHWLNAVLFITLAATGLLMHASENLERISLGTLIAVHNAAALLFIVNFLAWLVYQAATRRLRHYLAFERDIVTRLFSQARFYLLDIFKGAPHPYPVSMDNKFNPLQRVTYLGLMFGLVPFQIATGVVLFGFTRKVEWIMDLPSFRLIALTHMALSYLLLAFLAGHIYLATTGATPLDLIKSMITGWHEEEENHGENTNENA